MTDEPVQPEPGERGRYALRELPDGAVLIYRAANLCDRCLECGCGDQLPPLGPIDGTLVAAAKMAASGRLPEAMKMMMAGGFRMPGRKQVRSGKR